MADSKPLIGITTYGRFEKDLTTPQYDTLYIAPEPYVESIQRAGGVPVLLPPCIDDWSEVLEAIDGVILTGGADLNPATYGGDTHHPALTRLDDERDRSELELARCLEQEGRKPVLCICRGFELINVAFGGTLHEHIDDHPGQTPHRDADGGWVLHANQVNAGSRLAEAMQSTEVITFSGHHQAIRKLASCFDITATAPDGLIEGIEHRSHAWMLGVQWHPEKSSHSDPSQQALFDTLVRKAKQLSAIS